MKEKFSCSTCKYKFTRNSQPCLCPFCGQATVIPDVSPTAEHLLREVEQLHANY